MQASASVPLISLALRLSLVKKWLQTIIVAGLAPVGHTSMKNSTCTLMASTQEQKLGDLIPYSL